MIYFWLQYLKDLHYGIPLKGMVGHDKLMAWWMIIATQSEPTDAISGIGGMMMGGFLSSCCLIFIKNTGEHHLQTRIIK